MSDEIRVVFDGPPGPDAGRFVEVENIEGASIRVGIWHERDDGLWELRISGVDLDEDTRIRRAKKPAKKKVDTVAMTKYLTIAV